MFQGSNRSGNRINASGSGSGGRNAYSFRDDLQTTLVPQRAVGSSTPTFTRNLAAFATDFEGRLVSVPANAARMQGTRVVSNLIGVSEAMGAAPWSSIVTGGTTITPTTGQSDPRGGTSAVKLAYSASANGETSLWRRNVVGALITGNSYVSSLWMKADAPLTIFIRKGGAGGAYQSLSVTTVWQRFAADPGVAVSVTLNFDITQKADGSTGATSALNLYVFGAMAEDITGQTNQNPSEYVSVGVLSAPYHGLGIDGIKSFGTLNGNTVASNVVTEATGAAINSSTAKFGVLPGVAGSYFSTPDAAANRITGDIGGWAEVALTDWTAGDSQLLIGKWNGPTAQRSFLFFVSADGKLNLDTTSDGVTETTATSSVAVGSTDATVNAVGFTRVAATGKVNYYISSNRGVTWTLLGSADVATTAGDVFNGTATLNVGAYQNAGSAYFSSGRVYRAKLFNAASLTGTLAVDFNPNDSTSAQTWTSATTGEVWTTNGAAKVFGNTHATYGIAAPWDANGPKGLLTDGAAQNLQGYSDDMTQVATPGWRAPTNVGITANTYVSLTGATTLNRVRASAGNEIHLAQSAANITHVAASETMSFTAKYVNHRWIAVEIFDGTNDRFASFDLLNGVAGALSAGMTSTITPTALSGVYRVTATMTAAVGSGSFYVVMNNSDTASRQTWNAAGTEDVGLGMFNYEVGSFASSPIPTTTTAVTRPADVLTYPAPGNIASVMTVADSITPTQVLGTTEVKHFGTYVDADNSTEVLSNTTTNLLTYSSDLTNAAWTPQSGGLTVAISGTAPDGSATANVLTASAGTTAHRIYRAAYASAIPYVSSVFAKAGTATWLAISEGVNPNTSGAFFDLANGVVGAVNGSFTAKITPDRLGYYRCEFRFTNTNGYYMLHVNSADNQSNTWNANGEYLSVWGTQAERGTVASFYKATTTAAVTQTTLVARKRISGINHEAWVPITRTVGTTQKYVARFDSSGIQIALNGVLGTADATGTAAQIGSTFQIGGDGNGGGQDYCTHRFEKASTRGLPDAVIVSMSS